MSDEIGSISTVTEDYIRFRITTREKRLIKKAAQSVDMSMSNFCRLLAVNAAVGILSAGGKDTDDEYKAAGELVSIALKVRLFGLREMDEVIKQAEQEPSDADTT